MGLLKSILSSVVSDTMNRTIDNAVRKGVGDAVRKGVGDAIGKAVGDAVKPTADRLASESAKAIDSAATEINQTAAQVNAAAQGVSQAAPEARPSESGLSALEQALTGWKSSMEQMATRVSAKMKVCPQCGEVSPADKAFCPHCGAKLPEKTMGQDYVCPKCGEANLPGTKFCGKCGTLLPGAEAEVNAQKAKDDETLSRLASLQPQFPAWTVGGSEFVLEEQGSHNGYPVYRLELKGGQRELDGYIALLKGAGFTQYGDEYWKTVDGICRTFDTTEAVSDTYVRVAFYVSNYDKKSQPKPAEDPLGDLKSAAKGIFGRFMK